MHRIRELSTSHWQARVLHEACERSVFTELAQQPGSAQDLAVRLGLHPESSRRLLEALAALGLLDVREGLYSNTELASRYLVEGAPEDQIEAIYLYRNSVERWERLAEALHCGHTPPEPRDFDPRFIHAMHCTASVHAPLIAARVPASGRLLDVGGGSGTYGIHFLLQNPNLRVTHFDREAVGPIAQEYAEIHEVAERFETVAGDYLSDPLGEGYDVILLSNILHNHSPVEGEALLRRVFTALKPGGRVAIQEFLRGDNGDGPLFPALFSLYMMLTTTGGGTLTEGQLRGWMRSAGFGEVKFEQLPGTPSTLVTAVRPS